MKKIVLTGGPCAGKTTMTQIIARTFGDKIIVIPEAASIIFSGGFPHWSDLAIHRSNIQNFEVDLAHFQLKNSFLLLSLICMTSGLMNAALSHSSHATVRITHLTGITTDLGRGISELISFGSKPFPDKDKVLRVNRLKALTILFFILGSLLGAFLFYRIYFKSLLIPALYFAYAGEHGRRIKVSVKF